MLCDAEHKAGGLLLNPFQGKTTQNDEGMEYTPEDDKNATREILSFFLKSFECRREDQCFISLLGSAQADSR
jgi:hypothetical protein